MVSRIRPVAFAVLLLLVSVRGAGSSAAAETAWARALERRGVDPSILPDPIALTPEIESAARDFAGAGPGEVDQLRRIQAALFDSSKFTFAYDSGATFTAAEALAAKRGNCVAITNLFIAMARSRGLRVKAGFMTPHSVGEKKGDLVYVTAHVVAVFFNFHEYVVFDFYRERADPNIKIRLLEDLELGALYLNNRAVEDLGKGDYPRAVSEFEAVVKLDPNFAAAHGNLGVVKRRLGDVPGALDAYRRALALEPRNPAILGNLSALYTALGRDREARAALDLADMSLASAYTILARGDLEAADGRPDDALRYYRRAARVGPRLPEPQIAIARLERSRGHADEARRAALRALKLAPGNEDAKALVDSLTD